MGGAAARFQPEDMQLLAWKFLDGCASETEQQQLAGCLNDDEGARSIYLQCVQLHVDLLAHFGGLPTAKIIDKAIAPTGPTRRDAGHCAHGQPAATDEFAAAVLAK